MTAHPCKDIAKLDHLFITCKNANMYSHYENQCDIYSGSWELINFKVNL